MEVLICCGLAYCVGLLGIDPKVTRVFQVCLGLLGMLLFALVCFHDAIPAPFTH